MELNYFLEDLDIIQKLDDQPNDVGGLSSDELKEKFDEAGNRVKAFLNNDLIPALNEAAGQTISDGEIDEIMSDGTALAGEG